MGLASIAGAVVLGIASANLVAGTAPMSAGAVPRSEIHFGRGADLDNCRVIGESDTFGAPEPIYFVATFRQTTRPGDDISVRFSADGQTVVEDVTLDPGTDCVGLLEPLEDLPPGSYEITYLVDGDVAAEGSFIVR
jgi:hypothetical protein